MSDRILLDGRVRLLPGDCTAIMPTLEENSIDSCVTDPPYALTSIVKRFGSDSAAPAKSNGATGVYQRADAGFMGQKWDTGEAAFDHKFWAEVRRVLKPGAHLIAMGGTRTYHHLAMAIERAGFEIRDQIGWCYGSGFPKSHDVSKGIDRARDDKPEIHRVCAFVAAARDVAGRVNRDIDALFGFNGMAGHWTNSRGPQAQVPQWEQWLKLKDFLSFSDKMDAEVWRLNGHKGTPGEAWATAEVMETTFEVKRANSDNARQWEGWGTALKPAWESCVLARKPLSEKTIAANVLRWGTGAINVDACRVATAELDRIEMDGRSGKSTPNKIYGANINGGGVKEGTWKPTTEGRWPANLIHDGSEEVLAAFPNCNGQIGGNNDPNGSMGYHGGALGVSRPGIKDSGSAARFFYTAKADSDDRIGSRHPTVKPLDLMQYLVRLVTPPKGTVLDPFAGTGTTGEAAWREGFNAVLIEREAEYIADIERRMALCLAGPDERTRESIKARLKDKPVDHGPLFGGAAA